jgi:hypothetical protein
LLTSWQVESLRARVRSLNAEVERTERKEHPFPEPAIIFKTLSTVLGAIADQLDTLEIDLLSPQEKSKYCAWAAGELEKASYTFTLVAHQDSPRIPFEIFDALAWAADSLLGNTGQPPAANRYRIAVHLLPDFNYYLFSAGRFFESYDWGPSLRAATNNIDPKIDPARLLLMGVPSTDARSILQHAIAAHELGHEFRYIHRDRIDALLDRAMAPVTYRWRQRVIDEVEVNAAKLSEVGPTDAYGRAEEELRRQLEARHHLWCEEIFSDLLATRLLGPAYVAAIDRLELIPTGPSDTHPPTALRCDLINEYLHKNLAPFAAHGEWKNVFGSREVDDMAGHEWYYHLAAEHCRSAALEFADFLQQVKSPLDVPADELHALCDQIDTYLENLAPPSTLLNEAPDWCSPQGFWVLLYAGWRFRCSPDKFERFSANCGRVEGRVDHAEAVLDRLITQSMQSLFLRAEWNNRLIA